MNSKVSIIVPVYNVGNYIERGITSLCKQDYTNIEIIIVDNGSTDNSINIIRRLASKDTRIVYISEKSQGVSFARNAGLKAATGDYIMFVDGDDWVEPDYVSYFLKLINRCNTKIAVDTSFYTDKNLNFSYPESSIVSSDKVIEWIYASQINVAVWNKIYKKSLLENLSFSNEIWFGEGMLFNMQCLKDCGKVAIGSKKVYHQVSNPNSAMRKFNLYSNYCGIASVWLQRAMLKKMSPEIEKQWEYHLYRFNRSILDGLVRTNRVKNEKLVVKECIRNIRSNIILALRQEPRAIQKIVWIAYCFFPITMSKVIAYKHRVKN